MPKLDVAFVIPNGRAPGAYGPVVKDAIEPPAKTRFMAAYLMRRNCGIEVLDANVSDVAPDQMAREVMAADPHLVVIPVYGFNPSSSTQTMPSARAFAQAIKDLSPSVPILFSGTHPAALPEKTLRDEPVDYVCGGEGPITVHELLQSIKSHDSVGAVRSLWYRGTDGHHVMHNAPAPLIDLNEEPALPGWSLMDPRKYRAHNWHTFYRDPADRGPYANPYSWEGCPFHCNFCNIQSPYREGERLLQVAGQATSKNSYRSLRPELFLEEVTYLVETFGVKYFKIPDEMFALNPAHVLAIARGVTERFGDSLDFWAYARVDTCKPQFLEPLRAAGFRWLALGIEAANSTVRSGQDKQFGDDYVYKVVAEMNAAGIEGALNYIFGLPGDTMASMQATYDLAVDLNSPFVNFYCAQALPGSQLYREARESGYPLPERLGGPGWIGHSQYGYHAEPYYAGTALTPAQILKFRDEAQVAYYQRPEYRAKVLADPNLGAVALRNVDEWIASLAPDKLKRRLIEEARA